MYEWVGVDPKNGLPMYNAYYDEKPVLDADGNAVLDDNGNPTFKKEYSKDGKLVEIVNVPGNATRIKTGKNPIPDLYGGFSTYLSLYGFDVSASFAYQLGGWSYDSGYAQLMGMGDVGSNWHKDIYNRWTPQNTETDVPRVEVAGEYTTTDRFLVDASYYAIKNITLGYSLPKNLMKKARINSVRVFGSVDNLALFSHLQGMDPQYNFDGSTDYAYTPNKTYTVGIEVNF